MKREGRQHGMVRTHMVLPLNHQTTTKTIINSPTTAGLYTRVQTKPTNHSKFTGKCSGRPGCLTCHQNPTTKSKNKTKGTNKLKSNDVVSNARLVSWRVIDGQQHGLNFKSSSSSSCSNILDQLESSYHSANSFYDDNDDRGEYAFDDGVLLSDYIDKERERKIRDDVDVHDGDGDGDEDEFDDDMSFCELGFLMYDEIEGDEDWCLVAEM